MKKDLTEIVFILDASGSMCDSREDTIGGFNSLIEDQKEVKGEANVTLVTFNSEVKSLYISKPISKVNKLTKRDYQTTGTTALYDAIGFTVDALEKRLLETKKKDLPEKVMLIITTDGYENASIEYNQSIIKKKLEEKENEGWEVIFIGANIDSYSEGAKMGVNSTRSANYEQTSEGIGTMYSVMSAAVSSVRTDKELSPTWVDELKKDEPVEKDNKLR